MAKQRKKTAGQHLDSALQFANKRTKRVQKGAKRAYTKARKDPKQTAITLGVGAVAAYIISEII